MHAKYLSRIVLLSICVRVSAHTFNMTCCAHYIFSVFTLLVRHFHFILNISYSNVLRCTSILLIHFFYFLFIILNFYSCFSVIFLFPAHFPYFIFAVVVFMLRFTFYCRNSRHLHTFFFRHFRYAEMRFMRLPFGG